MLLDDMFDFDPKPFLRGVARLMSVIFPLCLLFWIVTPSKNTIMLIAASEVGETVLTSEKAQEIGGEAGALATDSLRVLRKFINEQLGEAAE